MTAVIEKILIWLGIPAALLTAIVAISDLSCYFRQCAEPCSTALQHAMSTLKETNGRPELQFGRVEAINVLTRCVDPKDRGRTGINFRKAWLPGADFTNWKLSGVNFEMAQVVGNFTGTDLTKTELAGASLAGSVFSADTKFDGANIANVQFKDVRWEIFSPEKLEQTKNNLKQACLKVPDWALKDNPSVDPKSWIYARELPKELDEVARNLGACSR